MVVVKVAERQFQLVDIDSAQARTTKHELDIEAFQIDRNAPPQELHGGAVAIVGMDARAAKLQNFARNRDQLADVVFIGGVEALAGIGHRPAQKPIGTNHGRAAGWVIVIGNQKMVANLVETVDVALQSRHLGRRRRPMFVVEYVVAQCLRRLDFRGTLGQSHVERSSAQTEIAVQISRFRCFHLCQ